MTDEPLFPIDTEVGEIVLIGDDSPYTARVKARLDTLPYRPGGRELYPLKGEGTRTDITARVYVLVPEYTVEVDVDEPRGTVLGTVVASDWSGMKHHEVARIQARYYDADRALAMWEVIVVNGALDLFGLVRVWSMVEGWLVERYPEATRIWTDDSEPGEYVTDNRQDLQALGYHHLDGRVWVKQLGSTA